MSIHTANRILRRWRKAGHAKPSKAAKALAGPKPIPHSARELAAMARLTDQVNRVRRNPLWRG